MRIGRNTIVGDVYQGHGSSVSPDQGGRAYHQVSAGQIIERAGSPDITNHSPITKPAYNGMIRYNTDTQHLEIFLRGQWTNIVSDADIAVSTGGTTEANVTIQYLSIILQQISRNIAGSIMIEYTSNYVPHIGGTNTNTVNYLSAISGGVYEGYSATMGNSYTYFYTGSDGGFSFGCTLDAFTAALPDEPAVERWNYKYDAFASLYYIDINPTSGDGQLYPGQVFLQALWSNPPTNDPNHVYDIANNPNYGKYSVSIYGYSNRGIFALGARWFVSLFKYQNYSITNVAPPPALPTITPLTGTVPITINTNTYNFNLYEYIVSTYPNWDTKTALTINTTINSNIVVGSTSPSSAAFDTGLGWPVGTVISTVNNGYVIGCGGNGGDGADLVHDRTSGYLWNTNSPAAPGDNSLSAGSIYGIVETSINPYPGSTLSTPTTNNAPFAPENGGTAMNIQYPMTFNNTNGHVWSGGGGGAGGPCVLTSFFTFYGGYYSLEVGTNDDLSQLSTTIADKNIYVGLFNPTGTIYSLGIIVSNSSAVQPTTVNFVGSIVMGNASITSVSSTNGLSIGQILSGTGINPNTTIIGINTTTNVVTMSSTAISSQTNNDISATNINNNSFAISVTGLAADVTIGQNSSGTVILAGGTASVTYKFPGTYYFTLTNFSSASELNNVKIQTSYPSGSTKPITTWTFIDNTGTAKTDTINDFNYLTISQVQEYLGGNGGGGGLGSANGTGGKGGQVGNSPKGTAYPGQIYSSSLDGIRGLDGTLNISSSTFPTTGGLGGTGSAIVMGGTGGGIAQPGGSINGISGGSAGSSISGYSKVTFTSGGIGDIKGSTS